MEGVRATCCLDSTYDLLDIGCYPLRALNVEALLSTSITT